MKKLMETEKEETDAAVDAAIERQQAIEAGIRGDAAEREIKRARRSRPARRRSNY